MPPQELIEMFWWGASCLLIISIGISIFLSVIKDLLKNIKNKNAIIKVIGIITGIFLLCISTFYPFNLIPILIKVILGMICGYYSDVSHIWVFILFKKWFENKLNINSKIEEQNENK